MREKEREETKSAKKERKKTVNPAKDVKDEKASHVRHPPTHIITLIPLYSFFLYSLPLQSGATPL